MVSKINSNLKNCKCCNGSGVQMNGKTGFKEHCPACNGEGKFAYGSKGIINEVPPKKSIQDEDIFKKYIEDFEKHKEKDRKKPQWEVELGDWNFYCSSMIN